MIILFAGPTLSAAHAPVAPDFRVLPPAAQGDVYRAARTRPWGIGIVDGYFEHVPAVWHKEILWAMARGVHVFGAASMGALRAAELADFGMIGVGRIFEQFRDGSVTEDDEVAVAHLPADHDYRRVSDAFVDMRATFEEATSVGVCDASLATRLGVLAKRRHYEQRSWPTLLLDARLAGEDPGALDMLAQWLPTGRVEQKRRDALELIDEMFARRAAHPGPMRAPFEFQHTSAWDHALHHMDHEGALAADEAGRALPRGPQASTGEIDPAELLDELRLLGDEQLYQHAIQGALLRGLAEDAAQRHGVKIHGDQLRETAVAFREARGLVDGGLTYAWLAAQGLDPDGFLQMMTREARLRWIEAVGEPLVRRHLADQLRAMSCHGRLAAQVRAKKAALAREELSLTDLVESAATEDALLRWYFTERLGRSVPDDLAAYSERLGFDDTGALHRAVLVERWHAERA